MVVTTVGGVGRGRRAAAGDGLGVAALGGGGVLAYVSRASLMKRTVGAGGVFLGAPGRSVSKSVAVGTLGVPASLRCFLDPEWFEEKEEGWEEDGNVVGVDSDTHRSVLLGAPSSSVLVKEPRRANRDLFRVVDGFLDEVEELFVVISEHIGWEQVNFQLYRGSCRGKRKPGVIPDGQGLVEALVESIEIRCLGLCISKMSERGPRWS